MLNSGRIVGLTHVCSQSDVTGAERRGVFNDLRVSQVSCFLQSREEEGRCGWCVVSSFASLSLSFSQVGFWSADLFICPAVKKFVFYIVFLFWSDQIGFSLFLPWRSRIGRKITFNYFYTLRNLIDISLYAEPMHRNHFSPVWRKSQHR